MTVNCIRSGKPSEKIRDQSTIPSLALIDVQEGQGILKKTERYANPWPEALLLSNVKTCQRITAKKNHWQNNL
jgi:hypothetical protein